MNGVQIYWHTSTTVMVVVMVVILGLIVLGGYLADKEGDDDE